MGLLEKRDATRNDLKWFGLILAAVFGIIGLLLWLRGHPTAGHVLWIIGATLPAVYYLVPPIQHLMFSVWMGLTFPSGGSSRLWSCCWFSISYSRPWG